MKAVGINSIVIDGSVAIAWFFDEVYSVEARALLDTIPSDGVLVPSIFPAEVTNYFGSGLRKGTISEARFFESVALLAGVPLIVDALPLEGHFQRLVPLMKEYGLTSYDASYLELAMRKGAALATLDKQMRKAAVACGVEVLPNLPKAS